MTRIVHSVKTTAFSVVYSVLAASLFVGCGGGVRSTNPCDDVDAWANANELIAAYDSAQRPPLHVSPPGAPVVYVDFSSGLIQAYQSNPKNGEMISFVADKLVDPKITWYSMADGAITSLEGMQSSLLFGKVTNPMSYSKAILAPIKDALDSITLGSREALLITDFEEFIPNKTGVSPPYVEDFSAYAKEPFKRWMGKGNKITFFSNPYQEKAKDKREVNKRLYFVVFSVGDGTTEKSLLTLVDKALEGRDRPENRLDLFNRPFKASATYTKEREGGIYYNTKATKPEDRNVFEMDQARYVDGAKRGASFEFYPLDLPWSFVDKVRTGEKEEGMTYFLSGLKVNATGNDAFAFGSLGLKVYDVTADFEHFACCAEVPKHKPETVVDPDKAYVRFSDAQKAKDDRIAELCFDSTGTMKPEWVYTPPASLTEVPEVFQLNEELLANQLKADPSALEARILFDPNFSGTGPVGAARLLRVDVVLAKTKDLAADQRLEKFKWESITVKDKVNESLYTSLREALQDAALQPEKVQPVLHTYYILTGAPQ